MRIRTLIGSALLVTAVLGLTACGGGDDEPDPTATSPPAATATPTATATATAEPAPDGGNGGNGAMGTVVNIELTENPFTFEPDTLTFDAGTTYTLSFNAPREFHTFTVDGLGIDIFINAGEALQEVITPSTVGEFELICIPHEGFGMKGTVTVQ